MTNLPAVANFNFLEQNTRERILSAATALIASGGRGAGTTRAVAAAADVQAPTIYRIFGDKDGLFDAVAEYGLAKYVEAKSMRLPHPDPVQDLRDGWDMHVAFGLTNPALFVILNGDPNSRRFSPALTKGQRILRQRITKIALAGQLQVSEAHATALLQAGCTGTVLTLLNEPVEVRDLSISVMTREAVFSFIICPTSISAELGPNGAATSLRASLHFTSVLTAGERQWMTELLDRIVAGKPEDLTNVNLT